MKIIEVSALNQADFDLMDFVPVSQIPKAQLEKSINDALAAISSPILKDICSTILARYQQDLYRYPAASRNHHDYFGGLAVHISSMLALAKGICEVYPDLNRDLLLAGILLHDIGKIKELSGPIATEYTTIGKLIGHISIIHSEIVEYASSQGWQEKEEVLLLRHMLLSHHGELEYGSPVMPLTKEAEVLSFIDNLDAKMTMIDKALAEVEAGGFGLKSYSLEGRSFYKTKEDS
jgi:3'-5' exoribonuclease